jgi:hypothetical protein
VAGLAAVYSLIVWNNPHLPYPPFDPRFSALLFGVLAINSFLSLQQAERMRRHDGWERDPDVWG